MSDPGTLFAVNKKYQFNIRDHEPVVGRFLSATQFNDEFIITVKTEPDNTIHRIKYGLVCSWTQKD